MRRSAPLHLDPPGVRYDTHHVGRGHDDVADELFEPVVKVPGGQQNVIADQLVVGLVNILLDEVFDGLPITLLRSGLNLHRKDSIDRLTLEVHRVTVLQQDTGKDGVPPEVGTGQGEEELEGSEGVQSRQHLTLELFIVVGSVGNICSHLESILQLVRGLSVNH